MFTAIDLFAGAGGLSYGFEQADFDICLAVEKDAWAVDTYKANHKNQNIIEADINKVNSGNKEIEKVEFYTIDGMKVENPEHGTFIIKRTVYKDNTFNSEKIIYWKL